MATVKTVRIPLVFPFTARTWQKALGATEKDSQTINVIYEIAENAQLGQKTIYAHKRPGSSTSTTFASGVQVLQHYSNYFDDYLFATSTKFYSQAAVELGTLADTMKQQQLAESVSGSVGILAWMTNDEVGWFLYSDAISTNFPTFTGNRTSGSAVISGIASTTGIYSGQAISGTGIPASTRVLTVDSATQITMTANATSGSGTATTITKEAISKILDADFPTDVVNIVALGGYFFAGSQKGRIYNSALNDPSSWGANDFVSTDYYGDQLSRIFRQNQYIVGCGEKNGLQYYYIGGTTSGSVLSAANNLDVSLVVRTQPTPGTRGGYCLAKAPAPNTTDGLPGLYRINGANVFTPLSDNIIGGIIRNLQLRHIDHANIGDRDLMMIRGDATSVILFYDESTGMFGAFQTTDVMTSSFSLVFTKSGSSTAFLWDPTLFQDSGAAYTATWISEPWDGGTSKLKTIQSIRLIADTQASGTFDISWSDDNGANYTTARTFDMTVVDKRIDILQTGGQFRSRIFKGQHSSNTDFRGQALEIEYTLDEG